MKDETTDGMSPQRRPILCQLILKSQPAMKTFFLPGEPRWESLETGSRTICLWIPPFLIRVPSVLEEPCNGLSDVASQALRQLLTNPHTDLVIVRRLKDYAKAWSCCSAQGPEHTAAILVYYAAIASALVFHGQKITRHSYETLRAAFSQLVHRP